MQKFPILFLTNAYPDFHSSYRGIFIKKMASLLQRQGYDITVLTPKIYGESRYLENQGEIRVYRFPFLAGNKLLIEHEKIPYLKMILYFITGFSFSLYTILKNRSKLIHVHWAIPTGLIGLWASQILKKPFIVTIHGSDLRLALEKGGVLKKIFLSVCKHATHIQCVSGIQKEEIILFGLSEEKISVIPMGVDDAFYNSDEGKKKEIDNRPFTVLSNRNLIPIYNISLLLRAIPMILEERPGTRFLIAGEGSEKEALEREAKELNVHTHVEFLGRIQHKEMPSLLTQADIFVSTSLYDGTSVSLLEAMSSGCFPVVSDIPSNKEWIKDGENGLLFPVDDEKALAKKILDAIRNEAMLERGRRSNRLMAREKVLWSVCIGKIEKIYETCLPEKVT